mgnify:FL=1
MKKLVTGIIAATLAVTIGLGVTHASADSGSGTADVVPSVTGNHIRTKKLCAMQTKVSKKVTKVKAALDRKAAELTAARDAAQAAGRTRKAEKLNAKLAAVNALIAKLDSSYAAYQAWVTTNCTTPTPPPTPTTSTPTSSTVAA